MRTVKVDKHTLYVPDRASECYTWKTYYNQLKTLVGTKNARMLWLHTWRHEGDTSCTRHSDFLNWLKANELDVSNEATRALADLSDLQGNLFGLSKNLSKVLSIGVPVLLSGTVIIVLYALFKFGTNAQPSDLLALTPVGRGAKIAGALASTTTRS